jgi:hypothetical protein
MTYVLIIVTIILTGSLCEYYRDDMIYSDLHYKFLLQSIVIFCSHWSHIFSNYYPFFLISARKFIQKNWPCKTMLFNLYLEVNPNKCIPCSSWGSKFYRTIKDNWLTKTSIKPLLLVFVQINSKNQAPICLKHSNLNNDLP